MPNQFSYIRAAPITAKNNDIIGKSYQSYSIRSSPSRGGVAEEAATDCSAMRILTRGLARPGIVGLVDEATGYQHIRARNALETILNRHFLDGFQDKPDCSVRRLDATGFWRGIG